jgi:hypothetical protein
VARRQQCHSRCWYELCLPGERERELTQPSGPAHAVYFGTYEVVKEMAGGNKQDGKHHPLAAGKIDIEHV